jgi:hypothetical protein
MLPKFVLILYYLLPFSMFGQAVVAPNYPGDKVVPSTSGYYLENTAVVPWRLHFRDDNSWPLGWKETYGQVYREPLSLKGLIRHDNNKMGASATGGLVYTGGDDVFAYAHYGRTGKLIWRTSPISNNMMATRWTLANFDIFRRAALRSNSEQLR